MSILTFVTQEEIDDLDEDDQIAFMQLVTHAQSKLEEILSKLSTPEDDHEIANLQYNFMKVIKAAAKKLEIDPFASESIPSRVNYYGSGHDQFMSDLDHYITEVVLEKSHRNRQDSVNIPPAIKNDIRNYVAAIRRCIEESSMPDSKREALLKKLDEFEKELERRRLSLMAVTRLVFALWAVPGATWASVEVANKLITNIMQTVAEAKATEQEMKQLAPTAPPKVLAPPQSVAPSEPKGA